MSVINLWLWSEKIFDRDWNETLESQNATSVFLVSHLVWEAREQSRIEAERILWELKWYFLGFRFKDRWYLARNSDLLYREASYEWESSKNAYRVWSFELIFGWREFHEFVSHRLWLVLWQIECQPSINYKIWLRLEIKEWSEIKLSELWDALTDFIALFIKTLKIDIEELETLENFEWDYKDTEANLPGNFDDTEKEKLLFSISQSVKYNKIYFTDLTPIHPDFLHELLLYLDDRFKN